ncbi:MAG: DNA topoisomerase [Firmicutes bacterium]|nr:DNA topoisomerase [Bacillota bacterium]
MILIIAEKPSLGRDIANALPGAAERGGVREYIVKGDYVITWVFGHMLTLKEPEDYDARYKKWDLSALPITFDNWGLKIGEDSGGGFESKAHRVQIIGELLEKADSVIHAGDPDEEGQLLIDELLDWFNYKKPVMRLNTSDTTQNGLKKELANMKSNAEFVNEGKSAYARSVADMMVGVNLSRFFTCNNNGVLLSVGRVQTPTLGLVVNRDLQIEGHSKQKYYDIFADIDVDTEDGVKTVTAKYTPRKKDEPRIENKSVAEEILNALRGKRLENIKIEAKTIEEEPPLPFNLVKLQTYCSSHFGYNPSDVMTITQSLRENHKAITYNRSDCQYLTEEHYKEAPKTLAQVVKNIGFCPKRMDPKIHSSCFNDKNITAHFAIIPTNNAVNLERLTEEEKNVYLAVCKYYMAQFMPKAVKDKRKLTADADAAHDLIAHSSRTVDPGYLAIFKETKADEITPLSDIAAGTYVGEISDARAEEKETKPPSRYTKATLNEDMTRIAKYVTDPVIRQMLIDKDKDKKGENGSIGTSATRSGIIDGLIEKKYLKEDGKRLVSTELGRELYRILPDEIKQPDLTAKWWAIQEDIRSGEKTPKALTDNVLDTIKSVLHSAYPPINQNVMTNHFIAKRNYEILGTCPLCGGNIIESPKAFGCANWREPICCKFTIWKEPGGMFKNVTITKASAKKLIEGKQIKMKKLVKKDGTTFDAEMKLEIDKNAPHPVKFVFGERTPLGKCPKCGGDVTESQAAFGCNNHCGFGIRKKTGTGIMRNSSISMTTMKKWLKGDKVLFKKLAKKDGTPFAAYVSLKKNEAENRVEYDLDFNVPKADEK